MQKTDPLREQAQAQASGKVVTPAMARLKARSFGKPIAVGSTPLQGGSGPLSKMEARAAQYEPRQKPLVR